MKHITILLAAVLALSLLTGCVPAITNPKDDAFQDALDDARDDLRDTLDDARKDPEDALESWSEDLDKWGEEVDERFDGVGEKVHVWAVQDADGKELGVVTDPETVEKLDGLLNIQGDGGEDWTRLSDAPADPICTYVYRQEKTLLAGQDPDAEREYEDLLEFTVDGTENIVTLRILGGLEEMRVLPGVEMEDILTFHVTIPSETAEALREPETFLKEPGAE